MRTPDTLPHDSSSLLLSDLVSLNQDLEVCWLNCWPVGCSDLSVCVHKPHPPSSPKIIGAAKPGFLYLLWGSSLGSSHPLRHLPSLLVLRQDPVIPSWL